MAWERVTEEQDDVLERHPVNGGYLYRSRLSGPYGSSSTMVFVPHAKATADLTRQILNESDEVETPRSEPVN